MISQFSHLSRNGPPLHLQVRLRYSLVYRPINRIEWNGMDGKDVEKGERGYLNIYHSLSTTVMLVRNTGTVIMRIRFRIRTTSYKQRCVTCEFFCFFVHWSIRVFLATQSRQWNDNISTILVSVITLDIEVVSNCLQFGELESVKNINFNIEQKVKEKDMNWMHFWIAPDI